MFPFYQNMSSHLYPSQRNYACCGQQHYPGWRAVPQHTQMDQHINPMNIGPWLHPGSHVHPVPNGYHGCRSHNPTFDYCSNGMSYCYPPPPPSMPAPMSCQPYNDYHGYATAPPHFIIPGAVQYYGKPAGKEQCCSCPTHCCNITANAGLKIEEQVPETAQKMDSQSSRPEMRGFPYPILWIPECHDKEGKRTLEPKSECWNAWHPIDLKQDLLPNFSSKEDRPQSPIPVFLLPGYRNALNGKEVCQTPNSAMERDPRFTVIPSRFLESEKRGYSPDFAKGELVDKLEVKPSSEPQGNGPMAGVQEPLKQTGGDCMSMKQTEDWKNFQSGCEERVRKDKRRQSVSPVKASILPPVCLRVDPLPKKRYGNGSSRSPSPPSGKGRIVQDQANNKLTEDKGSKVDVEKNVKKVIEVEEKKPMAYDSEVLNYREMGTSKTDEQDSGAADNEARDIQVTNSSEQNLNESKFNDKCQDYASKCSTGLSGESTDVVEKPLLSDEAAAVRIQSTYRGFEVRRWEPVKKLKQIAKIKGQVKNVNDKMHKLEANGLLQADEKQRAIINENIMCLLLELDTIQSIHPSVREVRKSVAKELICFHEKLDSITQTAGKNMAEAESKINQEVGEDMVEAETKINVEVNLDSRLSSVEENTVIQDDESVKGEMDVTTNIQLSPSVLMEENVGELPSVENQADQRKPKPLGAEEQPSCPQKQVPNTTLKGHLLSAPDPTNQHIPIITSGLELAYDDGLQELPSLECSEVGGEGSTAVGEQAPVILPDATDVKAVEDIWEEAARQSAQQYEEGKPINDEDHLVGSEAYDIANDVEENKSGPDQSDEHERPPVEKFVVMEHNSLEAVVKSNDEDKSNSETKEGASDKMYATDCLPHYSMEDGVSKNLVSDAPLYDMLLGDEENCITKDVEINRSGENTLVDTAAPASQSHAMDDRDQVSAPVKVVEPVASVEESSAFNGKQLVEQNEKLRRMVESLIAAGKEQMSGVGELSGRVRDLERQLARKRRLKLRNHKHKRASCGADMYSKVEGLRRISTM